MSRFTLITLGEQDKYTYYLTPQIQGLHDFIDKCLELGCYFKIIHPRLIILLSNGLSKEKHYEIFNELSKNRPDSTMISVLHEIPVSAVYKASRLSRLHRFLYEEGVEQEYTIGYFTIPADTGDVLEDLAKRISILSNVANMLLNTGSLPIHFDFSGLLAVLNKKTIQHIEYVKSQIRVGIASNINAAKAVEEAVRNAVSQ